MLTSMCLLNKKFWGQIEVTEKGEVIHVILEAGRAENLEESKGFLSVKAGMCVL